MDKSTVFSSVGNGFVFRDCFPRPSKEIILVTEWNMLSPLITDIVRKLVIASRFSSRLKWQINVGFEDHNHQWQHF
jgi:hypothetical protein